MLHTPIRQMTIQPKYNAAITINNNFWIKVYLARPIDIDMSKDLQNLNSYEGIRIIVNENEVGKPWLISCSCVYDIKDIACEVEKILRNHGINNLLITIENSGVIKTMQTLISL